MWQQKRTIYLLSILTAVFLGCFPIYSEEKAAETSEIGEQYSRADTTVAPFLTTFLSERKLRGRTRTELSDPEQLQLLKVTTPAGYRLNYRYSNLGIPLSQALSLTDHPQLKKRLVETARWAHSPRTREQGLLGLATKRDPNHLKYFREALLDKDISIQFSAIEALQVYGGKEATALILKAAEKSWSPVIRVYAAQAVYRMGDSRGYRKLLNYLRDPNWLVRAMAARYLGELGKARDVNTLLSRIGPEQDNKFVLAEVCVGALKLLAKKSPARRPPPRRTKKREVKKRFYYEMDPLVISAPRIRTQLVDVRIDNSLIGLLEKMAKEPPPEEQILDPVLEELKDLYTPNGIGLKIRYFDLSILLIEGLAGTRNFTLVRQLEAFARENPSARVRAASLVALGYEPERKDLFIFQEGLRDSHIAVRFAAVEGLSQLDNSSARSLLAGVAQSDSSAALRVYASQALIQSGDLYGKEVLFRAISEPSWVVRAMGMYYLGLNGNSEDFDSIVFRLRGENNDFAAAEASLALLRIGAPGDEN